MREIVRRGGAFFGLNASMIAMTVLVVFIGLGEKLADPLAMYLTDLLTLPASLAGLPAASVPTAVAGGLPIGMQLVTPHLDEATLIRVAAGLERCFPFGERRRRAVAAALGEGAAGSEEGGA